MTQETKQEPGLVEPSDAEKVPTWMWVAVGFVYLLAVAGAGMLGALFFQIVLKAST